MSLSTFQYPVGIGTLAPVNPLHVVGLTSLMGNVGIGTTTPIQPLHVAGPAFMSGNVGMGITTQPAAMLDITGATSQHQALNIKLSSLSATANAISVQTANLNPFTFYVSGSGTVGIGTSAPQQTLHVNGTQFVNGRIGIGISQPLTNLHVQGTTRGVPYISRSSATYDPNNPTQVNSISDGGTDIIFVLDPDNYKTHEIRFNYYPNTQNLTNHTMTIVVTGASSTAYTTNFAHLTGGSWSTITPVTNGAAPTLTQFQTVNARQNVSGIITVYNHDQMTGTPSLNITVDITTPVPGRITGNMRVTTGTSNVNELRLRFPAGQASDLLGHFSITSYPCDYL